jgi:putative FmdB family regulatory protein
MIFTQIKEGNMPLYEYECGACKERFEMIRRMSERDYKVECPKCGKKQAQRLLSCFSTSSDSNKSAGASSSCGPAPGSRFS